MTNFFNVIFTEEISMTSLLISGIIIAGGIFVATIIRVLIARGIQNRSGVAYDAGNSLSRIIFPLIYLAIIYAAVIRLPLTEKALTYANAAGKVLVTLVLLGSAVKLLNRGTDALLAKNSEHLELNRIKPLRALLGVLIWLLGLLFLLDNLGFNISAIVAGLGISGIAVAIAAQGILGDLFNYFVILFDRPFEPGDFIIFDDKMGSVKRIGIKTTRIQTLSGEQLVVSNSSLTTSRIHNYKHMQRRRIVFKFGLTYNSPADKLQKVPGIVTEIIQSIEHLTFDRCHFSQLGDFAFMFETVYYVESPDYLQYMDAQQAINLQLVSKIRDAGLEFAFPSQTVYLEGAGGN